jgi:hypothetical protein
MLIHWGSEFDSQTCQVLDAAFDKALKKITQDAQLKNESIVFHIGPLSMKMMQLARTGQLDPEIIASQTVSAFREVVTTRAEQQRP